MHNNRMPTAVNTINRKCIYIAYAYNNSYVCELSTDLALADGRLT